MSASPSESSMANKAILPFAAALSSRPNSMCLVCSMATKTGHMARLLLHFDFGVAAGWQRQIH